MRFLWVILLFLLSTLASAQMPTVHLKISGHSLSAEVAYTQKNRIRGLMYRKSIDKNSGMLFVFPESSRHNMWMANTSIPLSVAFLDKDGIILNISYMLPQTKTKHSPISAAKYALEMNLGWFKARKIKKGERVTGLEKAPDAK